MSLPLHLVSTLAGVGAGSEVVVEGDEAHHAVAVRRLTPGEWVQLTDGAGALVSGQVLTTGKRRFVVRVEQREDHPAPQPSLTVIQALPKGDRGERAVEVLTEIGVSRIVPWAADRSVAVWRGERADKGVAKWRATAREAAKQARRPWAPEVAPLAGTEAVAEFVGAGTLAVVLHEGALTGLAELDVPASGEIVIVVGPEGGLADEELATFAAAGAHQIRLGAEVLRTSTAGVAAVAALLSRTPRWRPTGS